MYVSCAFGVAVLSRRPRPWLWWAWCCALAVTLAVGRAAPPAAQHSLGPSHTPSAQRDAPHHVTKRSFFEIQCKGVFDKSIFARLDRICEDCYNLFREPQLHSLCRTECFTSDYFKGCLEALQLTDEMAQIQIYIKQLHGAEPGV